MDFGTLTVDATPSRASYNLLTPLALMRDTARKIEAKVLEDIGTIAAEGTRMSRVEKGGDVLLSLSREALRRQEPVQMTWRYVDRPIINYKPASGGNIDFRA